MSDGDRDRSVLGWIRTLVGRIRNGNGGTEDRRDGGENEVEGEARSDPLDGLLAHHEREKMDDIVESASEEDSEENSDDDRSGG